MQLYTKNHITNQNILVTSWVPNYGIGPTIDEPVPIILWCRSATVQQYTVGHVPTWTDAVVGAWHCYVWNTNCYIPYSIYRSRMCQLRSCGLWLRGSMRLDKLVPRAKVHLKPVPIPGRQCEVLFHWYAYNAGFSIALELRFGLDRYRRCALWRHGDTKTSRFCPALCARIVFCINLGAIAFELCDTYRKREGACPGVSGMAAKCAEIICASE